MVWPSTFQPYTRGYMVDSIDDELKRSGTINSQIEQCITDSIAIYQRTRFRFNEGYDYSFNTVVGEEFYAISATIPVLGAANNGNGLVRLTLPSLQAGNLNLLTAPYVQVYGILGTTEANGTWGFTVIDSNHIDLLGTTFQNNYVSGGDVTTPAGVGQGGLGVGQVPYMIDYVLIQIGTARFELDRMEPKDIDLLTQSGTQMGQPYCYSYFNEQMRFYPVPSAVYPIIIGSHEILPGPTADNTTGNRWMMDGERLIRSRAKYELAVNYLNDPDLAARFHPENGITADALYELRKEAAKITGTGRVRPTQF